MYPKMKRLADFGLAVVALVALFPVLLLVSVVVVLTMGRPVFFRQTRPGLNQKPFEIYKFRTMTNAVDTNGALLSDKERLTRVGRYMRRSSVDELPQLLNIVRGEMSFIGPRPLLFRYIPYFRSNETVRFDVRPGIAGLAQIRGRNTTAWDLRLASDVEYVENMGLLLDLQILFAAIRIVLRRSGIVDAPNTTMLSLDEERRNESR